MTDENEYPEKILTEVINYLGARVVFDRQLNEAIEQSPYGNRITQINCRCNQQIEGPKNES